MLFPHTTVTTRMRLRADVHFPRAGIVGARPRNNRDIMAKPRSEVKAEVRQAVDTYLDQLICDSAATGRGIAVDPNLLRPCSRKFKIRLI